jgi:YD repeat-containing protein
VWHNWATFGYTDLTLQTNFLGVTDFKPANGTSFPVLAQVALHDGSYYRFAYNTWGQVTKITRHAANGGQLAYVSYNLPAGNSVAYAVCPRFTLRHDWAEGWYSNLVVTTTIYAPANATWSLPDNSTETGIRSQVTLPDSTVIKIFSPSSGRYEGLSRLEETWSGGVKQRAVVNDWTQDDETLTYQQNPRVRETNVYDGADWSGNRRRTTIDYTYTSEYCMPSEVKEYAADAQTVLRRTRTDYYTTPAYLDNHILGLVKTQAVYDGSDTLFSKIDYQYDEGGVYLVDPRPAGTNIKQHDDANYGPGYLVGRGNLTSARRWDVTSPTEWAKMVESNMGYDLAGSVMLTRDPSGHQVSISYADSFSDTTKNSLGTFAYPTTITDPDTYTATSVYHYDMGVVMRTKDPRGAEQMLAYDKAGRLSRTTLRDSVANKDYSYTRWVYLTDNMTIQSFTLLQSGGAEAYSAKFLDGAGRVRAMSADHPGSVGGYSGQTFEYNKMGGLAKQSNPAEITGDWEAAGDDQAGWYYSRQTYDWKGRPLISTNTDGTKRELTYEGCGCAGGQVVTLIDEVGRQQKQYSDVLGRVAKTEDLNTNGSVYRTTNNTYNTRDQVTRIYVRAGSYGVGQETLMTYDGHGRLETRKVPEQTSPTTYSYFKDDNVYTVKDARGAVITFGYNKRHQVTAVSYVPPAGITDTASAAYNYDANGNCLWMTDGQGRVDYEYDTLSRLKSETRKFNAFARSFKLSYDYNLAGELMSITDPFNAQVGYTYDEVGRVTGVTGAGFANISQYASQIKYRAWGSVKHLTYGSGRTLDMGYNSRLKVSHYELSQIAESFPKVSLDYQYYEDARLRYTKDLMDPRFDRSYTYDHMGRMTQALSGAEARGGAATTDRPYKETFGYNVWGNVTSRITQMWSGTPVTFTATYVNNRVQNNSQWQYDADGRVTQPGDTQHYTYDAAGRKIQATSPAGFRHPALTVTQDFDGDGRRWSDMKKYDAAGLTKAWGEGGRLLAGATPLAGPGYIILRTI